MKNKTVIFEEKYNTNIKNFNTVEDIDKFIEKKEGKKLEIVSSCKLSKISFNSRVPKKLLRLMQRLLSKAKRIVVSKLNLKNREI